jgi:hypothetical protein
VKRLAAIETAKIEELHDLDRGITMTAAMDSAVLEAAFGNRSNARADRGAACGIRPMRHSFAQTLDSSRKEYEISSLPLRPATARRNRRSDTYECCQRRLVDSARYQCVLEFASAAAVDHRKD